MTKLAQALEAAHGKGVIHRDLKPSNVMMVAGVGPVVMDFGLAKQVRQPDQKLTQVGSMLGTPAYMPPEQVNGELERMGPASDVYSLGVILYELLTGRLPFEGTMAAILRPNPLYRAAVAVSAGAGAEPGPGRNLSEGDGQGVHGPLSLDESLREGPAGLLAFDARDGWRRQPGADRRGQSRRFSNPHGRAGTPARGQQRRFPTGADRRGQSRHFSSRHGRAGTPARGQQRRFPSPNGGAAGKTALPDAAGSDGALGDSPPQRARETIQTADATGDEGQSKRRIGIGLAVGVACVLLSIAIGLWAGGVIRVRTADGILVIKVNEPNPDLYVDGEKVTVTWQNGGMKAEVRVKPGTRKVELKKDGFRVFGQEVTLEDHGRTELVARLDPGPSTTPPEVACPFGRGRARNGQKAK